MFRIRSIDSRHRATSFSSRARRADADDSARRAEATAAAAAGEGASARGGWRRREKGRKEERRWEAERRAMAIAANFSAVAALAAARCDVGFWNFGGLVLGVHKKRKLEFCPYGKRVSLECHRTCGFRWNVLINVVLHAIMPFQLI